MDLHIDSECGFLIWKAFETVYQLLKNIHPGCDSDKIDVDIYLNYLRLIKNIPSMSLTYP